MKQILPVHALLITVVLFLGISAEKVVGQFSYSINYTVNDGLPSSKVYDMLQDSRGYIWFATENGVSRFNGYVFENFTTTEGLPTNSTVKLYEDYKGRVWFLSYQGSLSYFENDSVKPLEINKYLIEKNIPFVANLYVDTTDVIWLSLFNGGLFKVVDGTKMEEVGKKPLKRDFVYFYLGLKDNGHILAYVEPDTMVSGKQDLMVIDEDEYYIRFDADRTEHHYGFLNFSDYYLMSFGKKVYRAEKERITDKLLFEHEIVSINEDQNNNVWISEKFNGVYIYRNGDIAAGPTAHFLESRTVSKVLQDTEGNYWFSTSEYGVYFVPSLAINSLQFESAGPKNEIILSVDIVGETMFFSTDGKEIYTAAIEGGTLRNLRSLDLANVLVDNVYSILGLTENSMMATADPMIHMVDTVISINSGGVTVHTVEYGYEIKELYNGDYVLAHANGLKIISGSDILYNSPEHIDMRIFSIEQAPDSSLWLGSIHGLYKFNKGVYTKLYPEIPELASRISTLVCKDSILWAGSFDNGLFVISGNSVFSLNTVNGLSSNRVKSLFAENDSIIWVGTNRGLNRVTRKAGSTRQFTVEVLDIWDGLPSNEINAIKKNQGFIWLGTDKGIVTFDPHEIEFRHQSPRLYLRNILVEELGNLALNKEAKLKYNQNNLSFTYNAISFKNPSAVVYSYQLVGLNDKPNETYNTSVRYHDLPPGDYTFVIQARNDIGDLSDQVEFQFVVRKHFTQTHWFILLIVLVSVVLVSGVVRNLMRMQKKRSQLQRQLYLAEQKAMLAQMNPHFIFNSLNSIQNFILDNDSKNANIYLVTFSSLIRRILEGSKRNFISLKEELETIKLYLELEKFRFADKFDFHIEVYAGINIDQVYLPSMILQPYLENAIWHGIVPKEDHGLVQLIVAQNETGRIIISILDNGIGREKSATINKRRKHHKPTGIKNVEDRIKLLNDLNRTGMRVVITDLYNENRQASGTLVEFFLEGMTDDERG